MTYQGYMLTELIEYSSLASKYPKVVWKLVR